MRVGRIYKVLGDYPRAIRCLTDAIAALQGELMGERFVRRYAMLGQTIKDAIGHYVTDVRSGGFPSDAESFTVTESKAAPGAIEPAPYSSAATKNQ